MKKLYLLCLMLFAALVSAAQDFEITSVESLPNDFSAREEMKTDHNDRQCALLRVATQNIAPEQREGFTFKTDLGSEIVERANRDGEIWLWVSPGLKYLRIRHRDWGQYELHLLDHVARVEALHTYKIVIRGSMTMTEEPEDEEVHEENFTVGGVGFTMKLVKGGTFWMGAQITNSDDRNYDEDAFYSEKPVHSVALDNYYIGETEVTQALWMAVMGTNPSYYQGDDLPVEVGWDEIVSEFLPKLNRLTGKSFRLPTEAEWEYAARGGRKSKGYKYAGSNNIGDVAVYIENSGDGSIQKVKSKLPNELGLYDMSGNIWEWCSDLYDRDYYEKSPSYNPQGPSNVLAPNVVRGGSSINYAERCRVSFRDGEDPGNWVTFNGFRLALSENNVVQKNDDGDSEIQNLVKPTIQIPEGAISGKFSISPTKQVYFSQGNLQYQASTNTWRFAKNQWDYVGSQSVFESDGKQYVGGTVKGSDNVDIALSYTGWIDLFGWGTSGWDSGAECFQPWSKKYGDTRYRLGGSWKNSLTGKYANADWGVFNAISNGGNKPGLWRTLTQEEWYYLLEKRNTPSGIRFAKAKVNGVNGVILLPDDWKKNTYRLYNTNQKQEDFSINDLSVSQWAILEKSGAVFLPAAGSRHEGYMSYGQYKTEIWYVGESGDYWSASSSNDVAVCFIGFNDSHFHTVIGMNCRDSGYSVRLVCPAEH